MTEQDWLASDDPAAMLAWLTHPASEREHLCLDAPSDRKLRLFACACCRIMDDEWTKDPVDLWEETGHPLCKDPLRWAANWTSGDPETHAGQIPAATRAALLRDIFGNPWQPAKMHPNYYDYCVRRGAIEAIARTIYDSRDFAAMPILADALEEAGCSDEDILRHCRGFEPCIDETHQRGGGAYWCPQCGGTEEGTEGWMKLRGAHVRGCWVLDLLLGKE